MKLILAGSRKAFTARGAKVAMELREKLKPHHGGTETRRKSGDRVIHGYAGTGRVIR